MQKDSIVNKWYAMLKAFNPVYLNFPKSQRYTLGDRIQNLMLDGLELLLEAYYQSKPEKITSLKKFNLQLEKIRFLIRLAYDLRCLSFNQYKELSQKINETGKICGAWLRQIQQK